jgi:asparagine synthase (glutamine-hydrolysing)
MSMAHSVEVRVPLLDDELVGCVASISGAVKLDPQIPKPLLVDALRDVLPSDVYTRPKQGFTLPWNEWLRDELRQTMSDALDDRGAGASLGLRESACREVWRAFDERKRVSTWPMVWSLYVLLDWCERHRVSL